MNHIVVVSKNGVIDRDETYDEFLENEEVQLKSKHYGWLNYKKMQVGYPNLSYHYDK